MHPRAGGACGGSRPYFFVRVADPAPARAAAAPPFLRARHMKRAHTAAAPAARSCAICLGDLAGTADAIWLPCIHGFCRTCIAAWAHVAAHCPTCRHAFEPRTLGLEGPPPEPAARPAFASAFLQSADWVDRAFEHFLHPTPISYDGLRAEDEEDLISMAQRILGAEAGMPTPDVRILRAGPPGPAGAAYRRRAAPAEPAPSPALLAYRASAEAAASEPASSPALPRGRAQPARATVPTAPAAAAGPAPHGCAYCGRTFASYAALSRHHRLAHPLAAAASAPAPPAPAPASIGVAPCVACSRTFATQAARQRHVRTVHAEVTCVRCAATYDKAARRVHDEYECEQRFRPCPLGCPEPRVPARAYHDAAALAGHHACSRVHRCADCVPALFFMTAAAHARHRTYVHGRTYGILE